MARISANGQQYFFYQRRAGSEIPVFCNFLHLAPHLQYENHLFIDEANLYPRRMHHLCPVEIDEAEWVHL